ncbi:MAG TPA: hypothetical protein VIW29_01115 [Polyangiaceae bacterium]
MALLALAIGCWTGAARAQEPDAGTRMAARELAMTGAEAFDKQDYVTALDRFQRAEQLYKVPSIAVMVARCLARVGLVVEAVDKYEETLRMPLDAAAPEAFQRAVADATAEVDGVRARVARLELRLPAELPKGLEVMFDDHPVPPALLGVPKPVNPGAHRISARAPGYEPYSYELTLAEGAAQAIEIALSPVKPAAASVPRSAPAPAPSDKRTGASTLTISLLAGGGVALAVGAVTGIVALNRKHSLDTACNPGCPSDMASDLDSFRLNRTISYVSFGVGIAAVGTGAYLLLHKSSSGAQVGARLLPGGGALTGSF